MDMIFILKFTMEHNSMNNVGRVKVLDLSSSSNNALYLYQVRELLSRHDFQYSNFQRGIIP